MRTIATCIILLSILFFPIEFSHSAEGSDGGDVKEYLDYEEPTPPPMPTIFGSSLKIIIALSFIISLILGGFYISKKYLFKGFGLESKGKMIRVIDSIFLGPRKNLMLVEVFNDIFLLGMTNEGITLLTKLNKEDTPDVSTILPEPDHSAFARQLKSFIGGKNLSKEA